MRWVVVGLCRGGWGLGVLLKHLCGVWLGLQSRFGIEMHVESPPYIQHINARRQREKINFNLKKKAIPAETLLYKSLSTCKIDLYHQT